MPMSSHLPEFLHKAPTESMQKLFHIVSVETTGVDWTRDRRELRGAINDLLLGLPVSKRDEVYLAADRIGQFTNDYGRRALRDVLHDDPDALVEFNALLDITACAVFVLDHDPDAFDRALSANYARRLLNGRDWTGFDFEPGAELGVRATFSIEDLARQLSAIFTDDGIRSRVVVDRFSLGGSPGAPPREQFTIFVEAPPEATLEFTDAAGVEPRTIRPVREGAIVFDPAERTLDVVGRKAGKAQRGEMADAFVETVLDAGAKLAVRPRRNLSLDRLKSRQVFEVRPEDGVRSVEVIRLSLRAPDDGTIVTVETGRSEGTADFHSKAERALGAQGPLARDAWSVVSAKVRIAFQPEGPKVRSKSVTFELKTPDRTNLRDQLERHRTIADTLLARWGLYGAP
jgi:hypothetical protein